MPSCGVMSSVVVLLSARVIVLSLPALWLMVDGDGCSRARHSSHSYDQFFSISIHSQTLGRMYGKYMNWCEFQTLSTFCPQQAGNMALSFAAN